MHIITKKTLQAFWEEHPSAETPLRTWFTRASNARWKNFAEQAFWEEHPSAETPLRTWFTRASNARWKNFAELRNDYPSADLVGRLTVFNIGGDNYRLIVGVEYRLNRIYIRYVLTHVEYDDEKWKDDEWYT